MSGIDVESLLREVSADRPAGEDLRYDPAYMELETLARGTPEQQIGETIVQAAEEPDWPRLRDRCLELFARTRDLRVAVYLALSLLKTDGMEGLRDGLAVLRGLVERFWEHVFPQLDPSEDNDPVERVNLIGSLAPPAESFEDPLQFRQRVREVPLCHSRQMGRFSYRDIMAARGEGSAGRPAEAAPAAVIDAAFEDTPAEQLQATVEASAACIEHLRAIEAALTARVGAGRTPSLDGLAATIRQVQQVVEGYLARRGYGAPAGQAEGVGPPPAGPGQPGPAAETAEVRSPQDVLRALDRICQYYEQHEPSSPVPLLLRRAKRLVSKSFLDIIKDLTPEAMRQIELIGGVGPEGQST